MRSDTLTSKIIELGAYLNSWKATNFSHTALVYEDDDGKFFLIEASAEKGVYEMEFDIYLQNAAKNTFTMEYTLLGENLITKENFLQFKSFFKDNFQGSLYSIDKCLKSFKFEPLTTKNFTEMKAEVLSQTTVLERFGTAAHLLADNISAKIQNLFRDLTNRIGQQSVDLIKKIVDQLHVNDRKQIIDLQKLENNTTQNKKFFFCTELVMEIVRGWTTNQGIVLPQILSYTKIANQFSKDLYPQELYDLIKEQGDKYIQTTL